MSSNSVIPTSPPNVIEISSIRVRGALPISEYFLCILVGTQAHVTKYREPKVDPSKAQVVEWPKPFTLKLSADDVNADSVLFQLFSVSKHSIVHFTEKAIVTGVGQSRLKLKDWNSHGGACEITIGNTALSCNIRHTDSAKLLQMNMDDASKAAQVMKTIPTSVSETLDLGERVSGGLQDTIETAEPVFETFQSFVSRMDEITKLHSYANAAWKVLSAIPKLYLQEMTQNKQLKELLCSLKETNEMVVNDMELHDLRQKRPDIDQLITDLTDHSRECAYVIQAIAPKSHLYRMMESVLGDVGGRIQDLNQTLGALKQRLDARFQMVAAVAAVRSNEGIVFIGKALNEQNQMFDLKEICYAGGVRFNKKKCCFPNTRVALLQQIFYWVDCFDESDKKVLLLTGVAGSGKSSIAHSVSYHYSQLNRLGSSFFFPIQSSNSEPKLAEKVFSTIARDIADRNPQFKESLAKIVKDDTSLRMTNQPAEQLESFILKPFEVLNKPDSEAIVVGPLLIVIDALDECPLESKGDLMQTLQDDLAKLPPNIRVVITSRPECVDGLLGKHFVRHLDLHAQSEAELEAVHKQNLEVAVKGKELEDIKSVIRSRLAGVKTVLDQHRPDWAEQLALHSGMLFISAETACKQILSSRAPSEALDDILEHGGGIDDLYLLALRRALGEEEGRQDPKALRQFKSLLSRLHILKMQFSANELNFMQGCSSADDGFPLDVFTLVSRLRAVLGGATNPDEPIHFLHSSFRDFLLDEKRSGRFCISNASDIAGAHFALSKTCVAVITFLRSMEGPKQLEDFTLQPHCRPIAYSVCFWALHLYHSGRTSINGDVGAERLCGEGNTGDRSTAKGSVHLPKIQTFQPLPGYSWHMSINDHNSLAFDTLVQHIWSRPDRFLHEMEARPEP